MNFNYTTDAPMIRHEMKSRRKTLDSLHLRELKLGRSKRR